LEDTLAGGNFVLQIRLLTAEALQLGENVIGGIGGGEAHVN